MDWNIINFYTMMMDRLLFNACLLALRHNECSRRETNQCAMYKFSNIIYVASFNVVCILIAI